MLEDKANRLASVFPGRIRCNGAYGNAYNTSAMEVAGNGSTVLPGVGFHQPGVYSGVLSQVNANTFSFTTGDGSTAANVKLGSATATNWYRSEGATGWMNSTYGGGIHMTDNTWVRTYGGKGFFSEGEILSAGNITAFSDARLKKDVSVIEDALDKVKKLSGYVYTRIDTGKRQTGLIAQELQQVLPEAIQDNGEYLSVAYGNVVGLLVEAVKDLATQVEELKGKK